MSEPYVVTVTMDDPAWDSPFFEQALAHELFEVAKLFRAERWRRVAAREAFWRDIGRPADGHLGAVGGE